MNELFSYRLLRKHPLGGFAFAFGYSNEEQEPCVTQHTQRFETVEEALRDTVMEPKLYLRIHPEVFAPKEYRFVIGLNPGEDPNLLLTVIGNPENGYTVRPFNQETDDLYRYNVVESWNY